MHPTEDRYFLSLLQFQPVCYAFAVQPPWPRCIRRRHAHASSGLSTLSCLDDVGQVVVALRLSHFYHFVVVGVGLGGIFQRHVIVGVDIKHEVVKTTVARCDYFPSIQNVRSKKSPLCSTSNFTSTLPPRISPSSLCWKNASSTT